jgi:hypothetical protein
MNCAQVKEQLIDFLYGELPAEARSAFTEHVQGCPACKAEVASYQSTLDSARAALGGPLLAEAPARVHLAVMAAANAAAKQAMPTKARTSAARDELGFFARLWRTPWFLPTCGAASIATVVFLVRVLKNPEVLPGQRPHSIDERSLSAPVPVPPPEPTMAAKPATAVEANADNSFDEAKAMDTVGRAHKHLAGKRQKASEEMQGLGGLRLNKGGAGAGAPRQFTEPPPLRPTTRASKDIDNLMGGFKERESVHAQPLAAPVGDKPDRVRGEDDRFDGKAEKAAGPAKKLLQNEPAADMARPTTRSPARSAGVPSGSVAPAPAYAPPPAAAPSAPGMRDYPAESAASASAPSPPSAVKRKAWLRSNEEAIGSVVVTDDELDRETDKAKSGDKPGSSLGESLRKAERLYASQNWNAAAAAYRDLLNRFPSHKDAAKWRDRMNESLVAEEQRQAKLKKAKAKTTDVLDGSKL